MNTKLNKILTGTLITAMILAVIPAFAQPSEPHDASYVWLEPSNLSGPGPLIIYCWTNISDLGFTYQAKIWWDNTKLQLNWIKHTAGYVGPPIYDWLDQRTPGASATTLTGPVIGADNALIGGTCMGDDSVPAYTVGTLFEANFSVIAAPPKGGALDTWITLDDSDTYILNPDLDTVPTSLDDAHYYQAWETPPKPHLAVENDTGGDMWVFGPYPPTAVCTSFDVDIVIKDYNASWWIHNVTLYLAWNTTLINMTNIVFDSIWGTTDYDYTDGTASGVLDELWINVTNPTSNPPTGDVLICTITFHVEYQGDTYPDYDESPLDIHDYELWDTSIEIPTDPEVDGTVIIKDLLAIPLAWLEVSSVTMGPEPVRGEHFNVTVSIKGLDVHWWLFGIEFRLRYPKDLIKPVACYEGPFLPSFAALQPGSLGTWWISYFEPDMWGAHVLYGNMILPNGTGLWHDPWPEGEGVVAIITFEVIYQSYGEPDLCGPLEIFYNLATGVDDPAEDKQNIVDVPLDDPVNGEYCITTDLPGRMIDVYGGALNRGYGAKVFPAPFGGQGLNKPMDLVIAQSVVYLWAEVTYNWWPVQTKEVGFEIEGPYYQEGFNMSDPQTWRPKETYFVRKYANVTDENGLAWIKFQMPWPCEDPQDLFGKYIVTATVDICSVVVGDLLVYDYYYLMEITKVTTDKYEYDHCEDVEITVEFRSKAQQEYPVLLSIVIQDELETHFGAVLVNTTVGGAVFCTFKEYTVTVTIHVVKWAFAGIAEIIVSAFDKDPTELGAPWCPPYTPLPVICIQPY